jgi:hypothetical protein
MKPAKPLFIALLVSLYSIQAFPQSARSVNNEVDGLMSAIRANQPHSDVSGMYSTEKSLNILFDAANRYVTDTVYLVRLESYKLFYSISLKSVDPGLQKKSLQQFTQALSDKNSTISGYCARQLSVFNREMFTDQSKNNIARGIQNQIPRIAELIKMAGYLNMTESVDRIREKAAYAKKTEIRWAAYLALARMGDQDYANRVVNAVRRQGINDNVTYELVPDLIYTRQNPCIDYAIEILFDEKKNCRSSNPDNPVKMQCGYRVMEYLAPVIADFPFQVRTSGDLETDNYENALITVREWFLKKGSDYTILDNSY